MHIFHKWDKWEYDATITYRNGFNGEYLYDVPARRRYCLKCGKRRIKKA